MVVILKLNSTLDRDRSSEMQTFRLCTLSRLDSRVVDKALDNTPVVIGAIITVALVLLVIIIAVVLVRTHQQKQRQKGEPRLGSLIFIPLGFNLGLISTNFPRKNFSGYRSPRSSIISDNVVYSLVN